MTFHKWMVGAFLTAVMLTALGLNAILFSARSFQYNLAAGSSSAVGVIDVARLYDAQRQIQMIRDETADARGESLEAQRAAEAATAESGATQASINTARAEIIGELTAIETAAQVEAAGAASMMDSAQLRTRLAALAAHEGVSSVNQQRVAALRGQIDRLATMEAAAAEQDRHRATLSARQRLVDGQLAEANRRILALQQAVVPAVDQYDRIVAEVNALRNSSPLNFGLWLLQMHPAFNSTLLVLLMGALGAVLYLFPAYMSRANPVTFAEIIVRLIFGMCAALAFYVIANATLAGFSFTPATGQPAPTTAAMNPFTVSLIGIVAGVMADDLASWIKNRGGELFRAGGAPAAAAPPAAAGGALSNTPTATATSSSAVNEHGGLPPV